MKKSERHLKLLMHLQSNRMWTVEDIAESFGVSRRTIFRDLNEIKELNIPVDYVHKQGFRLLHGYKVPPLMFNTKELAVIAIALSFMKSQPIKKMADDAQSVSLKINNVIPGDLKDYLYALERAVIVDPYAHHIVDSMNDADWHLISDAVALKQCIHFTYKNAEEQRTLSPYLVVYFEDHWNTIGFDHSRKAIRNFRLSDIKKPKIADTFKYRTSEITDPLDFIYESGNQRRKVKCNVDKRIADQFLAKIPARFSSTTQETSLNIEFAFDNMTYLAHWFLQFGNKVQLIEPKELIDAYKSELNQMLSSHN